MENWGEVTRVQSPKKKPSPKTISAQGQLVPRQAATASQSALFLYISVTQASKPMISRKTALTFFLNCRKMLHILHTWAVIAQFETGYRLEIRGSLPSTGDEMFFFNTSETALASTQIPTQWVQRVSSGGKHTYVSPRRGAMHRDNFVCLTPLIPNPAIRHDSQPVPSTYYPHNLSS